MDSTRKIAVYTGILFLGAILAYGIGTSLVAPLQQQDLIASHSAQFLTGILLMLLNSVFVIVIGVLLFPLLRADRLEFAVIYLVSRILESLLLTAGVISLYLMASSVNHYAYQIGMLFLGIGSLFLCASFYKSALLPRFLALWGLIGYAGLLIGTLLELCGIPIGLWLALPGGVFELFLSFWLIFKGFNAVPHSPC